MRLIHYPNGFGLKQGNMRTVDVIILKGGKTAKEINYLGEKPRELKIKYPSKALKEGLKQKLKEWKQVESKRRTFEIDFSELVTFFKLLEKKVKGRIQHAHYGYDAGAYHKAEILHSGKLKILYGAC